MMKNEITNRRGRCSRATSELFIHCRDISGLRILADLVVKVVAPFGRRVGSPAKSVGKSSPVVRVPPVSGVVSTPAIIIIAPASSSAGVESTPGASVSSSKASLKSAAAAPSTPASAKVNPGSPKVCVIVAIVVLKVVAPLRHKLGIDVPRLDVGAPALELLAVEHPVGIKVSAPESTPVPVKSVPRV